MGDYFLISMWEIPLGISSREKTAGTGGDRIGPSYSTLNQENNRNILISVVFRLDADGNFAP